jgi:DNA-binding NtrC family response regulator
LGGASSWTFNAVTIERGPSMKCLIVEDNVTIRMEYSDAMKTIGFTCLEVDTIKDAAYFMKTHNFAVILLDLQVRDGVTLPLADYLQVTGSDATVILITGTGAFPRGEATQMSPRIDYVMRKPVNLEDLSALVQYATTDPKTAEARR